MKKTLIANAALLCAGALLAAGTAQAALQDRDLDGDTLVDAFYDTDLDITWLRDADVNGLMNWNTAVAWADGFSFAGYDDWRLPTTGVACAGFNCSSSEMGHLWYVELGNPAGGPMSNSGSFQGLQAAQYWSGTEWAVVPGYAWNFAMSTGNQGVSGKAAPMYAIAVRPGDVPAIPEPRTYALMLAGVGLLFVARRRRSN